MGFFRYYARVFRVAASHSLSITQDVIFGTILIVGLGALFLRRFGMILNVANWLLTISSWQIAVGVLMSIVAIRLLMAPYWIHKETTSQIEDLKNETIILEIKKVRFDHNSMTEMYIEFIISNPGPPTILRDFKTIVENKKGQQVTLRHRGLNTGKLVAVSGHPKALTQDDFSKSPLAQGELRECTLIFTIPNADAKSLYGSDGNIFIISAKDIKNKIARCRYVLN